MKVSGEALQMLGAAGYMKDHLTELYYRDAQAAHDRRGHVAGAARADRTGVLDHDIWWD